jgi:hypothetical protein
MAQNRRVFNVIFINNLPRNQPIKRSAPKTFNAIKSSVWVLGRTLKSALTAPEYEGFNKGILGFRKGGSFGSKT